MKILLVGGGSGGHVTPLKAIASELLKKEPDSELYLITDRSFYKRANQLFSETKVVFIKKIFAGKYRRYRGKSFIWHVTHLPTLLKNLRDGIYFIIGFLQSVFLLIRIRPDVVFFKGGFLCVPVGYAASLFGVRIIIHDSDTKPGLTNRILARFADVIATGMPEEFYPYDKKRMIYTGIPVASSFQPITKEKQSEYKRQLGFNSDQPVLLLTGGGNGSVNLNNILSRVAGELLQQGWGIIQLAGVNKAEDSKLVRSKIPKNLQKNWQIDEFADMVSRLLAADVIVARTSASTLQECANAKKLVVGIASPHLEDQNMNSEFFASKKAIVSLDEEKLQNNESQLLQTVIKSFQASNNSSEYARNLHSHFAKPSAASDLANLILKK